LRACWSLSTRAVANLSDEPACRKESGSKRAGGVYAIENQDNWAFTFRVHRDVVL